MDDNPSVIDPAAMLVTRGYQQEMLDESLERNIIIALDTGSGKTHIAVLRLKHEMEREPTKLSWFFAPTVALCEQQRTVITAYIPVSVGIVSGANEPDQWKDAGLWERVLRTHRIMVSTPQVFLDALRHGYIGLGRDISLLIFDEAHHAADNHPYNRIMKEFYFDLPPRTQGHDSSTLVRPTILGLTASPIYGGNVEKAFQIIETNLDSTIRAPRRNRAELAQYVHRPVFKHVMYHGPDIHAPPFSTNLATLSAVIATLNIEDDPLIISLRSQLAKISDRMSSSYHKIDQKLSKIIQKESSFTHKGLRDFERTASDICNDLGAWAADWFVWKVVERVKLAANPFNNLMVSWKRSEKAYLLSVIERVEVSPVSYYPDDIADDCSDKVQVLIDCLLMEKAMTESMDENYSSIIFVQRRDAVLALAELLEHHPQTKGVFRIGPLLGTSDSSHRHSIMDITRNLVKDSQIVTLEEFRSGELNLIVSTAVAEEGIDIQACGSVIRWDPPPNMASYAQSRGRARKRRSTFTIMFEEEGKQQADVEKWQVLEQQMIALYNDPSRDLALEMDETMMDADDDEDEDEVFRIESTSALVTLHSAVSHLSHFCAVIPNSVHADNRPLYSRDPPEFPEGWHSFANNARGLQLYTGPFGSRVTLPRALPLPNRQFVVDRKYRSVISAHRHSAFQAYKALYEADLLNENLLPITSVLEPELEDEVKAMLADVEKREGLAKVSISVDPWAAEDSDADTWNCSVLTLEGITPLMLFTRSTTIPLELGQGPTLYRPGLPPIEASVTPLAKTVANNEDTLVAARDFTRRVFWSLNRTRMEWDNLDFSYLFLPMENSDLNWEARRAWLSSEALASPEAYPHPLVVNAATFGKHFDYPTDLTLVQRHMGFGRPFKFVGWRYDPLSSEEEEAFREQYAKHVEDVVINYPLLTVQAYPPRTNFLIPIPLTASGEETHGAAGQPFVHLLPEQSGIILLSPEETDYAFLLPSVLRFLSMAMTANSLRKTLFVSTPIEDIPIPLLVNAITAPSSGERLNYQRLETLGDTVLKFTTGLQLMAEYPLWHEGYLTRKKDHAVSNVRLAKENIKRSLYRWIIRDIMLGKKWTPTYFTVAVAESPKSPDKDLSAAQSLPEDHLTVATLKDTSPMATTEQQKTDEAPESKLKPKKKKSKKSQQLSTKVLADVVESVIGAAYLHGGFDLGYECIKYFGLGLKWQPAHERIDNLLARVDRLTENDTIISFPPQLVSVEQMLGYTFRRKLLLIEALTHASYQQDDLETSSYERMEFLGDSVLDMIVTDFLYHAPGKNYTPGHMHLRKSAVVNGHILAYICLSTSTTVEATIPRPNADSGRIEEISDAQEIHLYRCLLHSSPQVLNDQLNTFTRFRRRKPEIEEALTSGTIFPWASLTRLQAPKFFSDMIESIIGAVYLDTRGSMDIVRQVITHLGIMKILEHIVAADVDVLHPVSRLSLWAQKREKELEYIIRREGGNVSCIVMVDGVEEAEVTDAWRGKPSQEEAKYAAAEMAIKTFKLRDVGVNYELLKKRKSRPKKKKEKKVPILPQSGAQPSTCS